MEADWEGVMTGRGDLLLRQVAVSARRPDAQVPDPTWLTLFNRRFMSIAEDMGRVLQNAARSVNIRERLDFSCALFDRHGDLIANAPHIPVHLGSMGDSVRAILNRFGASMQSGDAYLINCPYAGGTHLPDITVVMPVFGDDGPRYFTAARAHHADVGGISPGSMPADSTRIDQEGCRSEGLLILRDGLLYEAEVRDWLAGILPSGRGAVGEGRHESDAMPAAARNPEQNVADLTAQIAACSTGCINETHLCSNGKRR